MNGLKNQNELKEGLVFIAEKQIEKSGLHINDKLSTANGMECTIVDFEYFPSHNCVMANCSNGQSITTSQLRKVIDDGMIKLN